jgi:glyoxylase-like metal-dependent hydrolase (beta-lactamase superfamily II)
MSVAVTTFVNGKWRQNCYLVTTKEGDALIIDPGSGAGEIAGLLLENGLRPVAILNTHAHYDHMGAVAELMERYGVPFYLHGADGPLLKRANLYRMLFESEDPVRVPIISENIAALPAEFTVGPFQISWLATPGHTEGSVCLRIEGFLFSGDTLMRGAVGRTDLPGGNRDRILDSLRMLTGLPGDTEVCGGHGPRTTLAAEFSPGSRVWSLLQ